MGIVFDQLDLGTCLRQAVKNSLVRVFQLVAIAPVVQGDPIYTAQFCPSNPYVSGQMLDGSYNNNNRKVCGRCYDVSLGPSGFPSRPPDCASANSYCSYHETGGMPITRRL